MDDALVKEKPLPKQPESFIDKLLSAIPGCDTCRKPIVSVLRLEGIIGKAGCKQGLSIASLNHDIEKAFKPSRLTAVCLAINSPGGSPVQSELIAHRIKHFARMKDVPVYAFIEDVGASGGYWLACAADEIYASTNSIVGSLGVISTGFGFHEAIAKLGIERRVHTEGANKSILDPFRPEKKEDVKILKGVQHHIHQSFIKHVKKSRGGKLSGNDDLLFNGEFWTGDKALSLGLIDDIDNLYSFVHDRFGSEVKICHITQKQSWIKRKLGIGTTNELGESMVDRLVERLTTSKLELY